MRRVSLDRLMCYHSSRTNKYMYRKGWTWVQLSACSICDGSPASPLWDMRGGGIECGMEKAPWQGKHLLERHRENRISSFRALPESGGLPPHTQGGGPAEPLDLGCNGISSYPNHVTFGIQVLPT